MTHDEILAPGGVLARLLDGYESRPQQVEMSALVAKAIAERQHLIVEAPTGVGKSLAYLVPLALHARAAGTKVVISTATIALQEQLIRKDLPLLQRIIPGLRPVLVKGRQNYISLRRLAYADSGQRAMFEDRDQIHELKQLAAWMAGGGSGDRGDLDTEPSPAVWRMVQSDPHNCLGRNCPQYAACAFYQARRRIEEADLLVVNHHLYFSDLALRDDHAGILPAHDVVVFDEAHALEDIATEHLGISISEAQVRFFLDGLWNGRGKGLLTDPDLAGAVPAVETATLANLRFWQDLANVSGRIGADVFRLGPEQPLSADLPDALTAVMTALAGLTPRAGDDNQAMELKAQAERAAMLAGGLRQLVARELPQHVFYAEVPTGRGTSTLSAHPLSVAEILKERLFATLPTAILTSATLAADDSDRFLFLRKRLGLEGGLAKRLDSPFDYQKQARLLVNRSPLDPNSPRFEASVATWLTSYLATAQGGAFVLFTSYRQLAAVHDRMRPALDAANRFVLRQGDRLGRSQMLDLFKRVGNAVLFGTSSFWEGVDVRGDALRHVVITKIPFEVPDHPLVEARHQEIEAAGGNPFMERSVPEAILRLKQGVGRLIRTRTDTGTIVICDHRVLTRQYGRWFIRALPPMPLEAFALE